MKKITQTKIAAQLGVTRMAVNNWFNGKAFPSMHNMEALARLHGVTIDKMLTKLKKSSSKYNSETK